MLCGEKKEKKNVIGKPNLPRPTLTRRSRRVGYAD